MSKDNRDLDGREALAMRLAEAARQAILPLFRSKALETSSKETQRFDPVTQADKAAETAIREILGAERPEDGILGEEFGVSEGSSGLTWVIDPIDGTRAFVAGAPTWGVLIALSTSDGPVMGLIDQPYIGERFFGGPNGCWFEREGKRQNIQCRRGVAMDDAILFSTFPEIGTADEKERFDRVRDAVKLTRYGMDCYAYALLAAGQIDLVIEAGLSTYDIHGPIAVVEAAGGVCSAWDGGPAHVSTQLLAAASPELHQEALKLLA